MKLAYALLAAFLSLFLFGCINAPSSSCATNDPNCIYREAVLKQDPYLCYNLPEAQREACFKSSTSIIEQKKMQKQPAALTSQPQQQTAQQPPQQAQPEQKSELQNSLDACASSQDADSCFSSLAKERSLVQACERVKAASSRQKCISNVALSTKKPADCELLKDENDKTLCRSFSSGS